MSKKILSLLLALVLCFSLLPGCTEGDEPTVPVLQETAVPETQVLETKAPETQTAETLPPEPPAPEAQPPEEIPSYSGEPFYVVNGNVPFFRREELTDESFEEYGDLDSLGRCTVTMASIGRDLMPTEDRGSISEVKPTGWVNRPYDFVDGRYLYNRCHLIGFQLTGENANRENLITGTRYLNVEGMLPFENMVADYVKETGSHVLYRVTPIFEGDNLVADGVLMEALSVEDQGRGITFCVYCYNVQPGVEIDYATGENRAAAGYEEAPAGHEESPVPQQEPAQSREQDYIVNINTGKFHKPSCSSVKKMKDKNKWEYTGTREDLISQGYNPCKNCNP